MSDLATGIYFMRHGESVANLRHLIVSDPQVGTLDYGLSDSGREQARGELQLLVRKVAGPWSIVSSDFLRARETAELAAEVFRGEPVWEARLRERFFGQWEGHSSDVYQTVWDADRLDPAHNRWGVESVEQVAARMIESVTHWRHQVPGRNLLIVSHGDPLQILQTAWSQRPLAGHRDITAWRTAEIRMLAAPNQA